MIKYIDYPNRETWFNNRNKSIGASEISIILGYSNYKSTLQLWQEKTGKIKTVDKRDDRKDYGTEAEQYLRELFKLKHKNDLIVDYKPFRVYYNDENPFLTCTLDGEITRINDGKKGAYECKTVLIENKAMLDEWKGKIPNGYFCQDLQQLYCTGFDFVILNVEIRFPDHSAEIREYEINRQNYENDIAFLVNKGKEFWHCVKTNKRPNVSLTL